VTRILLLSGGIDSAALCAWKRPDVAYTIDYGQRAAAGEIRAATILCRELRIRHRIMHVDCSALGSGDLVGRPSASIAPSSDWWPFRNQLLITLVAMAAVSDGGTHIWLASVASDHSHSDGSKEFFEAADQLLRCQIGGLRVEAPALAFSTTELVRKSKISPSLLAWTHSCHTGAFACGACRGCYKHDAVLKELGWSNFVFSS
jgi:7-cyano-7-deazaguanine synthase